MSNETSKCKELRKQLGHFDLYLNGEGLDIGCGPDKLIIENGVVLGWDLQQGDATFLGGLEDNSFDFVYSSHCLEHMYDVGTALANWTRVLKPGGWLYIVVPDYTLYEHNCWPSKYNSNHKVSFSCSVTRTDVMRKNHYCLPDDLLLELPQMRLDMVFLQHDNYNYNRGDIDQTRGKALAQICIILQKV